MDKERIVKEYYGDAFLDKLSPLAREVVLTNRNYMRVAFGENVDYERLFHQMLLAPETEEYLYSAPAPTSYEQGSRPVLEEAVRITKERRPDMLLLHPEIEESLKPKEKKKKRRSSNG